MRRLIPVLLCLALVAPALPQSRKKKKKKTEEEITQTLPALPDPPPAIVAETRRLSFEVSPLSAKGLLSQQTREALKSVLKQNRGAQIVKLRAFVAGTGDLRRVQTLVSEMFADKKMSLPVLTTVQVGLLPLEGAQIQIESTAVEKKPTAPEGLAFISGVAADSVEQSIAGLVRVAGGLPVLRATCFLSSLSDFQKTFAGMQGAFPGAANAIVQRQRIPSTPVCECEAVAKLDHAPAAPVEFANPQESTKSPNYSQVARVGAERIVLSGLQMGFRDTDDDVKLAFERLEKALEANHASLKDVLMVSAYPLSRAITEKIRALRFGFLDKAKPPASTLLVFEGLPSLDSSFGLDVIAVAH
ncbi:MAG: Rid family hydrolase [Bryobacteraceae bacterium]